MRPIKPIPFLICSEGLSTLMRLAIREGLIDAIQVIREGQKFLTSYLLMIAFTLERLQK